MNTLSINDNTVHLWRISLSDFIDCVQNLSDLLSEDEIRRVEKLRSPLHRMRFIIARAMLRKILQLYLKINPELIKFSYGAHGKPNIFFPDTSIQFNVSHSEGLALYAISPHQPVGVDIEKVKEDFKEKVAQRFFTAKELHAFLALAKKERAKMFYQYWSRKEAFQKALGNGIFAKTDKFQKDYIIENVDIHPDFKAAIAILPPLEKIEHWQWQKEGIIKLY